MANVFNYSDEPSRVSSPWSTSRTSTPRSAPKLDESTSTSESVILNQDFHGISNKNIITSLEAEPQEGPVEYKLHLLLRPRRHFTYCTTGIKTTSSNIQSNIRKTLPILTSQSVQSQQIQSHAQGHTLGHDHDQHHLQQLLQNQQNLAASNLTRNARLKSLTTQLLWRLEQSASRDDVSHNTTIASMEHNHIDAETFTPRTTPLPSVENSMGALYEIGVADDGTLVGLADDELEESLETLRTMAASLGCSVTVVRREPVGECEWQEKSTDNANPNNITFKSSKLYVAEASILPLRNQKTNNNMGHLTSITSQLRVTITGATMAGKTSLLGTLTTSTLDNGRGKSRMSLLKHQHEILSGMTSSVTHEILGYKHSKSNSENISLVNFAFPHVHTWNDIHSHAQGGRIVLFTDSAGHPRYRRTTVRGLIGWAPHWTLLCIPADDLDDTTGQPGSTPPTHETLGVSDIDIDLSQEHLELCLKLDLPLIVLFTKKDLATRSGLAKSLQRVLSIIKKAGRLPLILQPAEERSDSDILSLTPNDISYVKSKIEQLSHADIAKKVPLIFTSSIQGSGMRTLHALLHELPILDAFSSHFNGHCNDDDVEDDDNSNITLMHGRSENSLLEDTKNLAILDVEENFHPPSSIESEGSPFLIVGGLTKSGYFQLNQTVYLGPFLQSASSPSVAPVDLKNEVLASSSSHRLVPPTLSVSSTNALENQLGTSLHQSPKQRPQTFMASPIWIPLRVMSIRNLRQSTSIVYSDTVATLGLTPIHMKDASLLSTVRKGMVIAQRPLKAQREFVAEFKRSDVDPLSIGSGVVVYFASVRASARIVAGAMKERDDNGHSQTSILKQRQDDDDADIFLFGDDDDDDDDGVTYNAMEDNLDNEEEEKLLVTFQFLASFEVVRSGMKVLVMPGGWGVYGGGERGEKGVAGFGGFVGKIV